MFGFRLLGIWAATLRFEKSDGCLFGIFEPIIVHSCILNYTIKI